MSRAKTPQRSSAQKAEVRRGGIYCTHPEPIASGFCPDCEQHVNLIKPPPQLKHTLDCSTQDPSCFYQADCDCGANRMTALELELLHALKLARDIIKEELAQQADGETSEFCAWSCGNCEAGVPMRHSDGCVIEQAIWKAEHPNP